MASSTIPLGGANALVVSHLERLRTRIEGRTNEGPEALIADLVPTLFRGLAGLAGRPNVDLRGEAQEGDLGIPDFSVKDHLLLIGHVETKAPGLGADPSRFRGQHDRAQWERFKRLPNLAYTDGSSFGLYRSGERDGPLVTLTFDAQRGIPVTAVPEGEVRQLAALVARFLAWRAVAPRSLDALAEQLAPLCAVLRDAVRAQLDVEGSEVQRATEEFRDALFPRATEDQVADSFAQTCTYSMLLARSNGARTLQAHSVEDALRHAHPVLARVVRVLLDDDTEREIGWAVDTVRALIEVVDFEDLRHGTRLPGMRRLDDTWLHFYERFLAAYDPALRDRLGVYYTPTSVIRAQVALLDDILRMHLGRPLGLAAPGVTILDPGVGTGSYPLAVIESAAATARDAQGPGAVPQAVSALAQNLYAFEILVGPYSVAHLRIAEAVEDLGGVLPAEGVQVYLTDTLSSPYTQPMRVTRLLEPLAKEQQRAIEVKRATPILICLGNPPYERGAARGPAGEERGGWVVHGEAAQAAERPPLFRTFLDPAREHTRFSHIASLYNSYVYFWRWALWKVFEAPGPNGEPNKSPGMVCFISASSYLTGPGFLGMREHLRRVCDHLWIIDLGGEGHGSRREENVFAIRTPVAICIAARTASPDLSTPARGRYARIAGTRGEKYAALNGIRRLDDVAWVDTPSGWHDRLVPPSGEAYEDWPRLIDLFPWQYPGVKANRTWPIAPLSGTLRERWQRLAATTGAEERARLFVNPRHGRTTTTQVSSDTLPRPASDKAINDLTAADPVPEPVRYAYRSFDRQWVLPDPRCLALQRPPLWFAHSERQVYLTSLLTKPLGEGPAATITAEIPDNDHFRGSFGGKDIVPLYRDPDGAVPNVTAGVLDALNGALDAVITAEDLFAYAYAVLSSPHFTERFFDDLLGGVRLPITSDLDLFQEAVALGRRLIHLHTFGARTLANGESAPPPLAPGRARWTAAIPLSEAGYPERFGYDPTTATIAIGTGRVAPVDPKVWELSVSGHPVVEGWLRYRMREPWGRARSSSSPLDRMRPTVWPAEYTTELLELLWVLEATVEQVWPLQAELVDTICDGETVAADLLPEPTPAEREKPRLPRRPNTVSADQIELT